MATIKNYFSLVKFSHTIFAMPFAIIGFTLGIQCILLVQSPVISLPGNWIDWSNNMAIFNRLLLVIMCMVTARSAAMAFNRYLDRHYDALNPRTSGREIPAGIITAKQALLLTIICCGLFMLACYFINPLCFYLSPIALFVILFYSYTKRFTAWCHLVLGLGLSLAPIGAYLAVTGRFDILPLLFSMAVICWVSGFDIIYALQDEKFDKENALHSLPVFMGKKKALTLSRVLHGCSAIIVIIAGILGHFYILYWCGVAVFCGMLVYQQSLVKADDLRKVNIAFMTANGIASIFFGLCVCLDIIFF